MKDIERDARASNTLHPSRFIVVPVDGDPEQDIHARPIGFSRSHVPHDLLDVSVLTFGEVCERLIRNPLARVVVRKEALERADGEEIVAEAEPSPL